MGSITINGGLKTITLDSAGDFDAEAMYSDWKEWVALIDNAKYLPAFSTSGGESVGGGQEIAPYFFVRNDTGWSVKMPSASGEIVISGNLFPRDPSQDMFSQTAGFNPFLRLEVSTRAVVIRVDKPVLTTAQALKIENLDALVSSRSTFNPASDAVANVTLVATTTTNTDMRGTDGANTVAPDNTSIGTALTNINTVQTDLTTFTGSALPKIRSILVDTADLQENQGNFATATGFSTFDAANDTVVNVGTVATNTDMRGTDGANTITPANTQITSLVTQTATVLANQAIINTGVQKASKLIPHSTDL